MGVDDGKGWEGGRGKKDRERKYRRGVKEKREGIVSPSPTPQFQNHQNATLC